MDRLQKLTLWHQVSSADYLGPIRFRALYKKLGDDLARVFDMPDEELLRLKGAITKQNLKGVREQADKWEESLEFMRRQMSLAEKCGGRILTLDDPDYPRPLRESKMCHALLYCVGRVKDFADYGKALAIVGSRNAAPQSLEVAYRTAHGLAARGWVIVSGLAKGVDSAAHKGALDAGGKTIAVMGCGPDFIYPPESKDLYRKIKTSGLVLSEYPFGTRPEDWKLKKRNKTTVALAATALIVETGAKGGTINAAKACQEQKKRPLVLLPPWPCDDSGNVKVIEAGGVPVPPAAELPHHVALHVESERSLPASRQIGAFLGDRARPQSHRGGNAILHEEEFGKQGDTVRIRAYLLQESPPVVRVIGDKRPVKGRRWLRIYEKGHVHRKKPEAPAVRSDALPLEDWVCDARQKILAQGGKTPKRPGHSS